MPRLLRFTRVPKISVILSAVRRHKPSLAAALEQFVDGKVALEDEVAAILDLGGRIKA